MLKTYHGSCHCGNVAFQVDLDLSQGASKCNCTFCSKARLWGIIVKPAVFRLLRGEEQLTDYYREGGAVHHLFCVRCGVRPFERGYVEVLGGEYITVNLACLDDAEPADLISAPIRYMDGRNNRWFSAPAEVAHL